MTLNFFKKKAVVGVSVTPEAGLEVAQIDFETRTVLKYARRDLDFDNARREIADLDIFKESLQDIFFELQIPKGTEVVLNIPSVVFNIADYPASLDAEQVNSAIEEELINHPIFQNTDFSISSVILPNSTIQLNKTAYIVAQKVMLIEIAMQIKELGYTLITIDSSANSILNALIYNERVNITSDCSWLLLLVENSNCKIISMIGKDYVDVYDEQVSIGEVLGDEENYSTVIEAVSPLLRNIPSQYLYVVSKTNTISAQKLANMLEYNSQIIHQEANKYATAPYLEISPDIMDENVNAMSLDVIGAAIRREFEEFSDANFNLFNESLGDVYLLEQPPTIKIGNRTYILSMQNMCIASAIVAAIIIIIAFLIYIPMTTIINTTNVEIEKINKEIAIIQKYLNENKSVSAELFDEGDEIRMGLAHNKNIYTYYTIVGTEIPQKLWLTALKLSDTITIDGQADNIESVYGFFRNIKDYNPTSNIKLEKLGYATKSKMKILSEEEAFDTDSIASSINADFYEFRISNTAETSDKDETKKPSNKGSNNKKPKLPDLETIKE